MNIKRIYLAFTLFVLASLSYAQTPPIVVDTLQQDASPYFISLESPDVAWFQINHMGGDAIFEANSPDFIPRLGLFDSSGNLVSQSNTSNGFANILGLPSLANGTYYLAVTSPPGEFAQTGFNQTIQGNQDGDYNVAYRSAFGISGTISLPVGHTASAPTIVQVDVQALNDQFGSLGSVATQVTISQGQDSEPYSLTAPVFTNAGYDIRYTCVTNCGNLLSGARYAGNDFEYNLTQRLGLSAIPATIDFEFEEGILFTGSINLPSGTANGAIPTFVNVDTFDTNGESNGFFFPVSRIIIPDNGSQATFSMLLPDLDSGNYQIRYSCDGSNSDSNCGNLIESSSYYTPSGPTFDFNDPAIRLTELPPQPLVLTLIEGAALNGMINLPSGMTASEIVGINLAIEPYDANGNSQNIQNFNEYIDPGQDSVNFDISYLPQSSGSYRIYFSCFLNCQGLFDQVFFVDANGNPTDFDGAQIAANAMPASLNVTMLTGAVVSGDLFLPVNETAIGSISTRVELRSYDASGILLGTDSVFQDIIDGTDHVAYELNYITGQGFTYQLVFFCNFNCPAGTIGELYYTPSGNTEDPNAAFIDVSALTTPLTLQMEKRPTTTLNGQVSLPNGTAQQDIDFSVSFELYDAQVDYVDFISTSGTISAGQSSGSFSVTIPEVTNGEVLLSYYCNSNCGTLVQRHFYTPNEIRYNYNFNANRFSVSQIPSPLNLTLVQGTPFSAQISLPQANPSQDTDVFFNVEAYGENRSFQYSSFTSARIPQGQTSTSATVGLPPVSNTESYILSYGCREFLGNSCGDLFTNLYLSDQGPNLDFNQSYIDSLPSNPVLPLVEGTRINVTVSLPNGELVSGQDLPVDAIIRNAPASEHEVFGGFLDSTFGFIQVGSNSANLSLLLPNDPNQEISIYYGCNQFYSGLSACQDYILDTFYSPADGTVYRAIDASAAVSDFPATINVELAQGIETYFQPQFPSNVTIDEFVRANLAVDVYDSSDTFVAPYLARIYASPPQDGLSTIHIALPPAGPGGRYEVSYECVAEQFYHDCSELVASDPSYSFTVDADNVPDPIALPFLAPAIQPDAFEVDDTRAQAKPIRSRVNQTHSFHVAGDIDWVTFTLEEEAEQVLIRATPSGGQQLVEITLEDSNGTELGSEWEVIGFGNLAAGTYYIRLEGTQPSDTLSSYQLRLELPQDEELCVPIKAKGSFALVCL